MKYREIYIEKELLNNIISSYKKKCEEFTNDCNDIIASIDNLSYGWEGKAKDKFFNKNYPDVKKYMAETIDLLYFVVDGLEYIDKTFYGTQELTNDLNKIDDVANEL